MASKITRTKFKKEFNQKKEKFERLPLKKFYIFSFFLNIIVLVAALLSKYILPPEIPLFYGLPQSSQQISSSYFLFIPSLVSLALTVVNAYLSIFVDNTYLKKVLAFSTILISILSTLTTLKIIFLVGSI
ncbi:hypothetical protein ISR94_03475 [Candidatus Microgenomates bacterium]|nr:hypothetical protein [Candidatus Microgenomates bacterium]